MSQGGRTPLHYAALENDVVRVSDLLAHGADPYHRNRSGQSPIALARLIANHDVAQYFADLPGGEAERTS